MKKIMLICSAGMSTSLLVTKMEKAAKESGVEAEIWAVGTAAYKNELIKADVILLGPQIRYMKDEVTKLATGRPVEVIDTRAYGMIDGAGVLKQALNLANRNSI